MKHRFLFFLSSAVLALGASANETSVLLSSAQVRIQSEAVTSQDKPVSIKPESVSTDEQGASIYIVQLQDPSAASYEGGVAGLLATSPRATGDKRLDTNDINVKSFVSYLDGKQKDLHRHCEESLGRQIKVKHKYQYAFNGLAMEIDAKEAKAIAALPGVAKVTKERIETFQSDSGPAWIGAPKVWESDYYSPYPPMHGAESMGEGIVVAILDTGINHDHPSFADIGGDGYDHENPLGSGKYIPGSYCETEPSFCNDKLIGAWGFVQGVNDPKSPEDDHGHGSHTASTVAGNVLLDATINGPTLSLERSLSGVAPHANIIAYDVCLRSGCPGSALLAAVEQVIIDAAALPNGIQALNYSISGGASPWDDPVELAFLNATAAGVFVSASAGNAGPGPSLLGHNSPWVATVGAMTHNRRVENRLFEMSSDGASLNDIGGVGFTDGYGPADIVHASQFPTSNGSINDTRSGECLAAFPAGHFNGQIVMCDRILGFPNTFVGQNVLAGGAGGLVYGNAAGGGEYVSTSKNVLPAMQLGEADAEALRSWLASEENTVATMSGGSFVEDKTFADVTARFSSRGPNLSADILKPDISAPGVAVLAAVASSDTSTEAEFDFFSGTSMSAPHNAGAAALVAAIKPDWTPYEIKSALMMTAKSNNTFKEDLVTPADPFDIGAGRVNLHKIRHTGLVLNETPENFLAADPTKGGDPKTLNIASMKDSHCVGDCSWTRTVRNTSDWLGFYQVKIKNQDGVRYQVYPRYLLLEPNESADITVVADTSLAETNWVFSELKLKPFGWGDEPKLHMPVVINPKKSTNANFLTKTVDKSEASKKDILTYEINLTNDKEEGLVELSDVVPYHLRVVPGSLKQEVSKGTTLSDFSYDGEELTWSGNLDLGVIEINEQVSPQGYVPLADFVEPAGCPSNCDEGGFIVEVPEFKYNGKMYSNVIWSINGTLEVGDASGRSSSYFPFALPDGQAPNNILAPLWTDLDMGANGDGAEWYFAVLDSGDEQYSVFEWNNVPLWRDDSNRYTFQVWIQSGDSGNIWYVYDKVDNAEPPSTVVSVGAENSDGTFGDSYFYAGTGMAPTPGNDLKVVNIESGSAKLSFQAKIRSCYGRNKTIVNRVNVKIGDREESAIAATQCVRRKGPSYIED